MILPYIAIRNQFIGVAQSDEIKIGKEKSLLALQEAQKKYNGDFVILFVKPEVETLEDITKLQQVIKYGLLVSISDVKQNNKISFVKIIGKEKVVLNKISTIKNENNHKIQLVDFDIASVEGDLKIVKEYHKKVLEIANALQGMGPSMDEINPQGFIKDTKLYKDMVRLLEAEDLYSDKLKSYREKAYDIIDSISNEYDYEELLSLYESNKVEDLYENIISKLTKKIQFTKIDAEINNSMRGDLEDQQRDFLLREKMRQIRKMLKEDDSAKIVDNLDKDEDAKKQYPTYVLEAIKSEQARLASMMPSSPEANISKTYVDLLLTLPWRKVSRELLDINKVREVLNKNHYGLEKPKERILEFISVLTHTKANEESKEYLPIKGDKDHFVDTKLFINKAGNISNEPINNIPILTLIGPPGTGKTTLAKSIAESLDRQFIKVSLGGVKDESEIRGHRRTYVGAMPGKIISAIKKAGVSNPVILLDEIDKMSSDFRGDPVSAMLEVLDPEQNVNFQDHYLDLEYDLSKVLFIATANYYDSIPAPLIDRVELLELSTYTTIEKVKIARSHLLSKIYQQNALTEKQMQISDKVIEFIVRNYTRESGVRELKRLLDNIARKIVVRILDKEIKNDFVVTEEVVKEFLGPIKFENDENENIAQIGVVNGLAYTTFGGSTLAIEVTTFPGKEGLKLTGQLKDVMKESAQIALAYVRANAKKFGIDFDFDNNSIHIHVPEGAVPKDGPSAGVTFTTSIISALSKKPVPAHIGMTGEITLRGKVLPIGGLKEKSLAAAQFGIKKIFIPYDNRKNLIDVPEEVKKEVEFVPVKYYSEIYEEIFNNNKK
ncbi:endopeptidase La [Metamycoplasma buccale]|uniref:endopeptidase La n=1 Tax=Metamycoplasma buccale TaxID=55602 RepID=UPI00398E4C60